MGREVEKGAEGLCFQPLGSGSSLLPTGMFQQWEGHTDVPQLNSSPHSPSICGSHEQATEALNRLVPP